MRDTFTFRVRVDGAPAPLADRPDAVLAIRLIAPGYVRTFPAKVEEGDGQSVLTVSTVADFGDPPMPPGQIAGWLSNGEFMPFDDVEWPPEGASSLNQPKRRARKTEA